MNDKTLLPAELAELSVAQLATMSPQQKTRTDGALALVLIQDLDGMAATTYLRPVIGPWTSPDTYVDRLAGSVKTTLCQQAQQYIEIVAIPTDIGRGFLQVDAIPMRRTIG